MFLKSLLFSAYISLFSLLLWSNIFIFAFLRFSDRLQHSSLNHYFVSFIPLLISWLAPSIAVFILLHVPFAYFFVCWSCSSTFTFFWCVSLTSSSFRSLTYCLVIFFCLITRASFSFSRQTTLTSKRSRVCSSQILLMKCLCFRSINMRSIIPFSDTHVPLCIVLYF